MRRVFVVMVLCIIATASAYDVTLAANDLLKLPLGDSEANMLWLFELQAFGDHGLFLSELSNRTSCIPPHPDADLFKNVDCFPFTHAPEVSHNKVEKPFLQKHFVYGPSQRTPYLRSGDRLCVDNNNLPCRVGDTGLEIEGSPKNKMFMFGDVRSNENIYLAACGIAMVRRHNEVVDILEARGETNLFEKAQDQIVAESDNIVFGPNGLLQTALGPERGSCPNPEYVEDPHDWFKDSIFRIHNMAADQIGEQLRRWDSSLSNLRGAFFVPDALEQTGGNLAPFFYAMYSTRAKTGLGMVPALGLSLFLNQHAPPRSLAVANFMREIDTNVGSFNDARAVRGLDRYERYEDFVANEQVLAFLYKHWPDGPDTLPTWIGCRAEENLPGSFFGETTTVWIEHQFCGVRRPVRTPPLPIMPLSTLLCRHGGFCVSGDRMFTSTGDESSIAGLFVIAGFVTWFLLIAFGVGPCRLSGVQSKRNL